MNDLLKTKKAFLVEQVAQARQAASVLQYSWSKIQPDKIGSNDPELLEILEAMTARFARLEDILIKKVFRAVAVFELEDAERLIDILNLMEKLELIESTEQWIELKELRNIIVHEYQVDDFAAIHRRAYQGASVLTDALEKVQGYLAAKN